MVMNKGLQAHVIEKKFENADLHDVDLKANIDSTLSLPENIENLKRQGKLPENRELNSAEVRDRIIQTQLHEAIRKLDEMGMSEKSAEVDGGIEAEKTFKPPLEEEEFAQWLQNPSEYDIEGVDTPGDALEMELGFEM